VPFTFTQTELQGVVVIDPTTFTDERGFFMESYKQSDFEAMGLDQPFVQENHSRSKYGTLRGLHYQRQPKAQGKLVRVVVGEIFDVAVDIRKGSRTFGKWVGNHISALNRRLLYVPPWCAHGFCVLSPEAEVIYKATEEYAPDCEDGFRWDDPALAIRWPISKPIISERDRQWPMLAELAGVR
jgi:dTDP-4-dehydrorhamnose 3,5-epimerase